MSDEYNSRQRSMYSEADKKQQKEELAHQYDLRRARLEKKQTELQSQLSDKREDLRQAREQHDQDPQAVSQRELNRRESEIQRLEIKANKKQQKLTELDRRQQLGNECIDSASVTEGPTGDVTINAKVGPSQPRLHYEHENRSGLEARKDMDRGHSRSARTGFESDCGITNTPKTVNRSDQNHGIEKFVSEVYDQKRDGNDIWLKTVTTTHEGTRDLQQIQYEISTRPEHGQGQEKTLYRATINVDKNGKSWVSDEWQSPDAENHLKKMPHREDSTTNRSEKSARAEKSSCQQTPAGQEKSQKSLAGGFGPSESSPRKSYDFGKNVKEQRSGTSKTLSSSESEKRSATHKNKQQIS
ncbi:MAG: hypothetical protein IAG10_13940 [Planctomycetaceae bacterium]|nr:hypothetical protein [Planctomycetaceae bacterium]